MEKIMKMNLGKKIILLSVAISILSLFLPWADIGFARVNGFQQQGYLLILLFVYPVVKILMNKSYNKIIGIILGAIAIIFAFSFSASKRIDLFGESINVTGTGLYLFLLTCIGFIVGNVLNKEAKDNTELKDDLNTAKEYMKDASSKIKTSYSNIKDDFNSRKEEIRKDSAEKDNNLERSNENSEENEDNVE